MTMLINEEVVFQLASKFLTDNGVLNEVNYRIK